jgi:hypothetical protein
MGTRSDIICRVDPWHIEKRPERLAFSLQTPGKRPGFVLTGGVLIEQRTETRIPGPPLPNRWPLHVHMTQPLQLDMHALSKASNPYIEVLSQSLGRADQMG